MFEATAPNAKGLIAGESTCSNGDELRELLSSCCVALLVDIG